jgi:hypothetical protein
MSLNNRRKPLDSEEPQLGKFNITTTIKTKSSKGWQNEDLWGGIMTLAGARAKKRGKK